MLTWALPVENISEYAASALLIQVNRSGLHFDIYVHYVIFVFWSWQSHVFCSGDSDIIKSVPGDHWPGFQAIACLLSFGSFSIWNAGFNWEHCDILLTSTIFLNLYASLIAIFYLLDVWVNLSEYFISCVNFYLNFHLLVDVLWLVSEATVSY